MEEWGVCAGFPTGVWYRAGSVQGSGSNTKVPSRCWSKWGLFFVSVCGLLIAVASLAAELRR